MYCVLTRKTDSIHHHHPEGVVYRSFCLKSHLQEVVVYRISLPIYIVMILIRPIFLLTLSLLTLLESNFPGKSLGNLMGLGIPPLKINMALESNPLKSTMLVGRLGVLYIIIVVFILKVIFEAAFSRFCEQFFFSELICQKSVVFLRGHLTVLSQGYLQKAIGPCRQAFFSSPPSLCRLSSLPRRTSLSSFWHLSVCYAAVVSPLDKS